jgi:hypothetical protein
MKLEILDLAKQDLIEGFQFYEQKEQGLGDYFLTHLFSDIERLRICGGIHPISYHHYHRALSKRFPFAIYYTLEHGTVKVRSIIDCRRRPSWIQSHLKKADP